MRPSAGWLKGWPLGCLAETESEATGGECYNGRLSDAIETQPVAAAIVADVKYYPGVVRAENGII